MDPRRTHVPGALVCVAVEVPAPAPGLLARPATPARAACCSSPCTRWSPPPSPVSAPWSSHAGPATRSAGCSCLIGLSFAAIAVGNQVYLRVALDDGSAPALGVLLIWVGAWGYLPAFVSAIVFLPLLFPTGRPPSARWAALAGSPSCAGRWPCGRGRAGHAAGCRSDHPDALGIDGFGFAGVAQRGAARVAVPAAVRRRLVLRFRRSSGEERQQFSGSRSDRGIRRSWSRSVSSPR